MIYFTNLYFFTYFWLRNSLLLTEFYAFQRYFILSNLTLNCPNNEFT